MKITIVYVRTDYWGEWAVEDLLHQEKRCLAYAQANKLKVVKVLREQFYYRGKELPRLFSYLRKNPRKANHLLILDPKVLTKSAVHNAYLRKKIEAYGVKIESISHRLKIRTD